MEIAIVLTTMGVDTDATALGRTLVDEGLAACVNVLPPMTSVYRWKNKVEVEREHQMVIKTTRAGLATLEQRLLELHPYELPEFIVLTAAAGTAYGQWLNEGVRVDT